jgi:hypothetical protein
VALTDPNADVGPGAARQSSPSAASATSGSPREQAEQLVVAPEGLLAGRAPPYYRRRRLLRASHSMVERS